jgi:hypothetical protein
MGTSTEFESKGAGSHHLVSISNAVGRTLEIQTRRVTLTTRSDHTLWSASLPVLMGGGGRRGGVAASVPISILRGTLPQRAFLALKIRIVQALIET